MIKKLSPEIILSFKNNIKETNKELDQLFESVNSSFISSTNKNDKYKNIKFINHFKKSTNKWKKSLENKSDDAMSSIKLLVKNSVNKLSDDNFEKISDDLIFNLMINDYDSLITLSNELFNVILMHPVYIDNYLNLINKIYYVTFDKWNFNNTNLINLLITISQVKYCMDYKNLDMIEDLLDSNLIENINFIELEGLPDSELQIVKKSMKISNIKFIIKLYLDGFVDQSIVDNIINELINFKTTHSMEALIEILNICDHNDKIIFNNLSKLVKLKTSKIFDFRLSFIFGEALAKYEKNGNKNFKLNKKKTSIKKKPVKKVDSFFIGCENILEEYIMIEEFEEVNEYLKDSIENYSELCKFSDALIKSILCCKDTDFQKLKTLVKLLSSNKILKQSNWKKGINNNLKRFNDIILDYPKANKNLDKFITYSTKVNLIKKEFIDELMQKYDVNIN